MEWSIVGDDPILNVETEKAQFWSIKWQQEPDDGLFFDTIHSGYLDQPEETALAFGVISTYM